MEETFNPTQLLRRNLLVAEILERAEELSRRAELNEEFLEKLGAAVNSRVFDIFFFIWQNEPVSRRQLFQVCSRAMVYRALNVLEGCGVIKIKNDKIYLASPKNE